MKASSLLAAPQIGNKKKKNIPLLNPFLGLTPKYFFMDIKVTVTTKMLI